MHLHGSNTASSVYSITKKALLIRPKIDATGCSILSAFFAERMGKHGAYIMGQINKSEKHAGPALQSWTCPSHRRKHSWAGAASFAESRS